MLTRATNQDMRFTYDTNASANNDSNLPTIQGLAQLLTFLDTAHRLGLTSQETQRLSAAPDMTVVYTQQSQNTRPDSEITAEILLAIAGCILIFISINLYAGRVAVGVAEEKSSRVMELLLNAATPLQLMVGKIVGIGAAGLTQMACLVAVGIGALLLQSPIQAALFGTSAGGLSQYLTSVSVPFYLLFLVYFLLGFFLYATIYAGLGSMVKRQDEVQNAIMLPVLLLTSGYVLIFFAVQSPDATWVKVLSFIPFWTPTLMLVRIAAGTVYWWDIAVSMVLMLVTICACAWFSVRIYRFGVLMYGQRPGSGSIGETGTDELTAGERWDLSKNETTGFDGRRLFQQAAKGEECVCRREKGQKQHERVPGQSGRCHRSGQRHRTCAGRKVCGIGDEGRAGRCRGERPLAG